MIIAAGYPTWVIHHHPSGIPSVELVIAWRVTDGDVTQRPVPISAAGGELDLDSIGAYLGTRAEVEAFERMLAEQSGDLLPQQQRRPGRASF